MTRKTLAIIFAFCTLALAAQDFIQVKFKGAKPTISDFAEAFLTNAYNEGEYGESIGALCQAWSKHKKGRPLLASESLTVDERNGFILYEERYEENLLRIEMCYWNEADGKHKLFAYNIVCFNNGVHSPGQYDGMEFYRYNNASKKMYFCEDPGFEKAYCTDDNALVSYALPRTGKDITVTTWYKTGKKLKTLKWNGHGFNF